MQAYWRSLAIELVGRSAFELRHGLGALGDGVLGCVGNKFVIFRKFHAIDATSIA